MIFLIWVLNFAISWLNAWGCGKSWNETKHVGGVAHFMNWMGAIMSACGFTWCYLLIAGFGGAAIPIEQDDGTMAPLLTQDALKAFMELGYLVIIGPILGSGLALTIHSWAAYWRSRSLGDGVVAGWNSFAQVYNTVSALEHVPDAASGVASFFKGEKKDGKVLVVALVICAALGGILTTYAIVRTTARNTARERALKYAAEVA